MDKNKLTKEELSELVGGFVEIEEEQGRGVDIVNKNKEFGCLCTFKNQQTISNENEVFGCECRCN